MAQQDVTIRPEALPGTQADVEYFVMNTGDFAVRVGIYASSPEPEEKDSFPLPPLGWMYLTPGSGDSIYAWTSGSQSSVTWQES